MTLLVFRFSATIESVAAEQDHTNKSLIAYNNKNSALSNASCENTLCHNNSTNLNGKSPSVGEDASCSQMADRDKLHYDTVSDICCPAPCRPATPRVPHLSSDDEYKTASETSAASNLSNDNTEFFDWGEP